MKDLQKTSIVLAIVVSILTIATLSFQIMDYLKKKKEKTAS